MGKNSESLPNIENMCLIALGSNLSFGDAGPDFILDEAFALLQSCGFVIRARSRYFSTPAFPAGAGPDFVNAAAALTSPFGVAQTLAHLHGIEAVMGRQRGQRWGARTLDLDLLALGAQVLPDAETHAYWRALLLEQQMQAVPQVPIVPHPRLAERAFVLVPLLDVAPQWCHPVTGKTVQQMHDALPQAALREVVAL